ncbi:MAG: double zinc ribbon domain-containing protein [Candidatus Omnitrophota bacterium]
MFGQYVAAAKDILLPSLCFQCEQKINEGYLCPACQEAIEYVYPPSCRACAQSIENNKTGLCANCIAGNIPYDRIISVALYKEPLVNLIHLFKYKNCDYLAGFFATLMITHLAKIGVTLAGCDLVPIPMHASNLRERGYNQSSLLAQELEGLTFLGGFDKIKI